MEPSHLDGHQRLLVVGHGDEPEALALVGLQVSDHLDVLNGPEGPEELPEDVLLGLGREVVDEDAPAGAVGGGHAGEEGASGQEVPGQGGVPGAGVSGRGGGARVGEAAFTGAPGHSDLGLVPYGAAAGV